MPAYADRETLTEPGQTIYDAIHADGAKPHDVRLTRSKQVVQTYETEKVLFEVYDAVDEVFAPSAPAGSTCVDLWIGGQRIKRLPVAHQVDEESGQITVSDTSLNEALGDMNIWMLENAGTMAALLAP